MTWPKKTYIPTYIPTHLPTYLPTYLATQDNPADLWQLRRWLQFLQLRTRIHDNLCYLTIKSDSGQHLQFLRCLVWAIEFSSRDDCQKGISFRGLLQNHESAREHFAPSVWGEEWIFSRTHKAFYERFGSFLKFYEGFRRDLGAF